MEQVTENQAPAGQDQIKILTELVQQLLRERECKQEPEDPYVSTRIPVTDFSVYSELTEALPSIGENFFQTPLTEEERKVAIHSCPKNMKKTDSAIYGIQLALAQVTRPIDYYVHRRIQDNKVMETSKDREILFANTMRALLSDICATVTQESLQQSTIPKGTDRSNTVKAPSTTAANTTESSHKTHDHQSNFRRRGRGRGKGYVQIGMVQDNGQPMSSGRSGERIQNPLQDPRLRITSAGGGTRILQPAIHDTEGERRPLTRPRPPDMEPRDLEAAYQYKGTIDGVVCTEARECGGSIKIRGHYLPGTAGINRKDMASLPQDQHPPTSDLCFILVSIAGDILNTELEVCTTRCRPIFIIPEKEAGSILQLVPGQQSAGTECPDPQLDKIRQSILLSTPESDSLGNSQGSPRASYNDSSEINVEIHDLVPRPYVTINFTATSSSNICSSGSKKRKVTALGKQALELDGLKDQRRFLKTLGLGNRAIDFIFSKKRRVRRRFSPAELAAHPMFSEFIKTLDDTSIKSFIRPAMDISPVIELFREWGQNSSFTIKQITVKICWLLSVTGSLRASDIHTIDDQRSHIEK
ncbi:hypothetical protein AYI70_g10859 [Smittium culicis]|uniref:Uncharacterized protein n=1 Tax=Smittium culicis TaxID=133412 RepID=A0A1R1WZK5_9FUNG|nr:hypothetical protein AYI70_g11971 [Smittium culicis]OMJ09556.1 hypothetical protein AYI70_g10859 [Smittium culicis]